MIQDPTQSKKFLIISNSKRAPFYEILSPYTSHPIYLITPKSNLSSFSAVKQKENFIIKTVKDYFSYEVEQAAYELHKENQFTHIIAPAEHDILRAARLRDICKIKGQNYASALSFRDKILMKVKLSQAGIRVPQFADVNSILDIIEFINKVGFPILIKPKRSFGSQNLAVLRNDAELKRYIESNKALFDESYFSPLEVEKYIEGPLFNIDGLIRNNTLLAVWPSGSINDCISIVNGETFGSYLLPKNHKLFDRLIHFTKDVLNALPTPADTAFNLEVLYDALADELVFCEVASRVSGGEIRDVWIEAFGIDIGEESIKAFGECPPSQNLVDFFHKKHDLIENHLVLGWLICPKKSGTIMSIQQNCPFDWVKKYVLNYKAGDTVEATRLFSDHLASFVLSKTNEENFKQRSEHIIEWFESAVIYQN